MIFARVLLAGLFAVLVVGIVRAEDSTNTIQPETVPQLLSIEWSTGPDLPQGFQDSDGGVIENWLVTACGLCIVREEGKKLKPGRYPRGLLNKTWALNLDDLDKGWQTLPEFPGSARQGVGAVTFDDSLCFWGGFSYDAPYSYADGWRLRRSSGRWTWDTLPALPWKNATVSLTVIGTHIYAFGGADYNAEAFFTETDRTGEIPRLGARLLRLDATDPSAGWRDLPECPGTPRWVNSFSAVAGKLYVIGGASGNVVQDGTNYGYCTVVDNWRFDPVTGEWTRLADLPVSSGNFPRSSNAVYRNRYILLPGGHQYDSVLNPDGSVRPKYGQASRRNPGSGLHNDVFVYDTHEQLFGRADSLPIDNNLPMTVVRDDEIFLLGGETGSGIVDGEFYGHHPDLFLRGRISETITPSQNNQRP